jgi:hypothetical protein
MSEPRTPQCPGCRYDLVSIERDSAQTVRCPECGETWTIAETTNPSRPLLISLRTCGLISAGIVLIPVGISWAAYPLYSGTIDVVIWCGFTMIALLASWGFAVIAIMVLLVNWVQHPQTRRRHARPILKFSLVVLAWTSSPFVASYLTIDYAVDIIANI